MKISNSKASHYDALYLKFNSPEEKVSKTIEVIEAKVMVDLDSKGQLYGIEVLDCVVACISGHKEKNKRKKRK